MGNNMMERMRNIQLNKKQQNTLFYLSLVMLGLFAFLFLGSREPVLFDDSGAYMSVESIEGVMPVYPLFLAANRSLFGEAAYLRIVIVEQAVLAVICAMVLTKVVRNKFSLVFWESYLVFFLLLLPFTIDMPEAMTTQEILTEGIAYALFYLLMITLLQAVWNRSYGWLAASFGMVFLLAMTRSQLQILFGIVGIVLIYIVWCREKQRRHSRAGRFAGLTAAVLGGAVISLVGVLLISRVAGGYRNLIKYYEKTAWENETQQAETEEMEDASAEEPSVEELAATSFTTSQYVSLIFSRGMYEADPEDVTLFDDEVLKGLYLALYEAADEAEQRYAYEQKGLWMWKDIVGGIGLVGKTCLAVPSEYYAAHYPEIITSENFSAVRNRHLTTIGMTLLKAHFGRFLYHTLMLLPSAFICTVFFQIAPVYGLCHLITLLLYVTAFALMIWGYRDDRVDDKYADFMALVLGTNVVMVVIISIVFFGQQRYLVYNFGIFYVAYGLLAEQLWKCRLRDRISGRYRNR
jgi:hypothetical protein